MTPCAAIIKPQSRPEMWRRIRSTRCPEGVTSSEERLSEKIPSAALAMRIGPSGGVHPARVNGRVHGLRERHCVTLTGVPLIFTST